MSDNKKLHLLFFGCSTSVSPLNRTQDLKDTLRVMYMSSAQYDNPPDYYVNNICNAIDGPPEGTYILNRIAAGVNASFGGSCLNTFSFNDVLFDNSSAFSWQRCTEIVIPMGTNNNDTMFQLAPFDLNDYIKECQENFNVTPRSGWITTEFGGHDIKSVLVNFASNIIFSNGLRDPYSGGGVLEDISDTVIAITTDEGAHCLDVLTPTSSDPDWLVEQREKEIKVIAFWIAEYNAKLASNKNGNITS